MKVLWICNIMLPVIAKELERECSNKEGWLSGLCDLILERQLENQIELHVAYPVGKDEDGSFHRVQTEKGTIYAHGFYENVNNAEDYDANLDDSLKKLAEQVKPDVIHCFGTEYAHSLAIAKCAAYRERLLIGMQGVCQVIAQAYMADLPEDVQKSVTFRDWLKRDSMKEQQQKFVLRGKREAEVLTLAENVTGRTGFDRYYVEKCNRNAKYFAMNETLRGCFYEGRWNSGDCEPHTIFLSQGDYPLKGLHYLLVAAGRLQQEYPDLQIRVAGNSLVNYHTLKDKIKISGYGKYLRRLIKDNNLEDRVHFLGRLTAEEMKAEYLKCGLYVCCSSNENSPNSLGEAMLLGVPCVAADVGGISDLFVDQKDGILYEGHKQGKNEINNACNERGAVKTEACILHNSGEDELRKNTEISELQRISHNLEDAIREMWNHPEKMQYYSQNAREHARKTHDKEQNYKKMTEIYAEIARTERRVSL